MLLDIILPEYGFRERHRLVVDASPEQALAAIRNVTPGEMPIVSLLFAIRSLPARLMGGKGLLSDSSTALLTQMLEFGFVPLADPSDETIAIGIVGSMFRRGGGTPAIHNLDEFLDFSEPGYVKAVMRFDARQLGNQAELVTETRVLATDPIAHRQFGRYWRVIRPGSGIIRRCWLRAAARRAVRET